MRTHTHKTKYPEPAWIHMDAAVCRIIYSLLQSKGHMFNLPSLKKHDALAASESIYIKKSRVAFESITYV